MKFNSAGPDKLALQANKLLDEKQFASIEWQLMQSNQILSQGHVANSSILDEPSIYRIYSMTKPVVSLLAMQLIGENKLKLNDAIAKYLPAMASLQVLTANGQLEPLSTPITVEHLLTHTAGFSYDFLPDCAVAEKYRAVKLCERGDRSLEEMIDLVATMPLVFQPGTQWRYSVSTDVLAHVLEKAVNQSLPELLEERIFQPLGMNETGFSVAPNNTDRLLPIYGARELGEVMFESDKPNELILLNVEASHPSNESSGFYRGGHGLYSTLADYLKFTHLLKTGQTTDGQQLLSPDVFDLMWSNKVAAPLKPLVLGFNVLGGYGWNLFGRVMEDPAQCEFSTVVGEGGWAGAASTYFWVDRSNDITGIVMSQYIGSTAHLGALMQHAAYGMFKG